MRAGARGSADASETRPRLFGRNNATRQPKVSAKLGRNGGKYGCAANDPARNRNCTSGSLGSRPVLRNAVMPPGTSLAKPVPNK